METVRTKIFRVLANGGTKTSTQIQEILNAQANTCFDAVSLGTVSSQLKKMVDKKLIIREDNFGPRGGYGYRLPFTVIDEIDVQTVTVFNKGLSVSGIVKRSHEE